MTENEYYSSGAASRLAQARLDRSTSGDRRQSSFNAASLNKGSLDQRIQKRQSVIHMQPEGLRAAVQQQAVSPSRNEYLASSNGSRASLVDRSSVSGLNSSSARQGLDSSSFQARVASAAAGGASPERRIGASTFQADRENPANDS